MIVIGVDGGGTKTAAVAADLSGRVKARAEGLGTNPNFVGRDAAFSTLRALLSEVSGQVSELAHVALCVPGLRPYEQGLAEALGLPPACVSLSSDVFSTFYGALGKTTGIVALAGTGSFVVGTNREGETVRAGGWGPVIGDEGSGQWIAVRALRAVGLQHDGRGAATRLTKLVLNHYGVADAHGLKSAVKLDNVSRLTYLVREAADAGDAVAQAILAEAGAALADMAADVAEQLGFGRETAFEAARQTDGATVSETAHKSAHEAMREAAHETAREAARETAYQTARGEADDTTSKTAPEATFEIALTGGLPRLGTRYTLPFAARLAERCPAARVVEPLLPPVGGAVLLALQVCGVAWTSDVLERLRQSLAVGELGGSTVSIDG